MNEVIVKRRWFASDGACIENSFLTVTCQGSKSKVQRPKSKVQSVIFRTVPSRCHWYMHCSLRNYDFSRTNTMRLLWNNMNSYKYAHHLTGNTIFAYNPQGHIHVVGYYTAMGLYTGRKSRFHVLCVFIDAMSIHIRNTIPTTLLNQSNVTPITRERSEFVHLQYVVMFSHTIHSDIVSKDWWK